MDFKTSIKDRGLKQKFIAEKLGVKQSIFSRYLKGDRKMPEDIKQKLIKLLNDNKFFYHKNSISLH